MGDNVNKKKVLYRFLYCSKVSIFYSLKNLEFADIFKVWYVQSTITEQILNKSNSQKLSSKSGISKNNKNVQGDLNIWVTILLGNIGKG